MEKKIEEIRNELLEFKFGVNEHILTDHLNHETIDNLAEYLIEKGYRKQEEAEWLYNEGHGYYEPSYYCSWCYYGTDYKHLFCPCCGRKMKGAD